MWHKAVQSGSVAVASWLATVPCIDTAALTDDEMRAHAIHLAIIGQKTEHNATHFQMLHFLIAQGHATVDLRDAQQCTALVCAAQYGDALSTPLLLRHGSDVHAVDESGDTALHWAAYKGHDDVCLILAEFAPTTVPSLLERTDTFGQTTLHLAALRGNVRAAKVLIELGAAVGDRDGQGKRPIDLVKEKVAAGDAKVSKKEQVDTRLLNRQREMVHTLEPTWRSNITMAPDKPYYYVQFFTYLALVGMKDVVANTPHWIGTHISWLFTFFMMNLTWQITRRTDPGNNPPQSPPQLA